MINIYSDLSSNSQQAVTLQRAKNFGEYKNGKVVYSPCEAAYLIEIRNAQLIKNNKPLLLNQALKRILRSKDLQNSYLIFKDLRKKGYIPKAGLKFGADFRVYVKSEKHAKYLLHITDEKYKVSFKELLTKTRISHSTAKKLLIAIIDTQKDITYLEIDWVKM